MPSKMERSEANYPLSIIHCQLSIIHYPLSIVNYLVYSFLAYYSHEIYSFFQQRRIIFSQYIHGYCVGMFRRPHRPLSGTFGNTQCPRRPLSGTFGNTQCLRRPLSGTFRNVQPHVETLHATSLRRRHAHVETQCIASP
jgi:hypothetical protein